MKKNDYDKTNDPAKLAQLFDAVTKTGNGILIAQLDRYEGRIDFNQFGATNFDPGANTINFSHQLLLDYIHTGVNEREATGFLLGHEINHWEDRELVAKNWENSYVDFSADRAAYNFYANEAHAIARQFFHQTDFGVNIGTVPNIELKQYYDNSRRFFEENDLTWTALAVNFEAQVADAMRTHQVDVDNVNAYVDAARRASQSPSSPAPSPEFGGASGEINSRPESFYSGGGIGYTNWFNINYNPWVNLSEGAFDSSTSNWGGCVEVDSFLPDGKKAGDIKVDDLMELADESSLHAGSGVVSYSQRKTQPGYRVLTESGVSLRCSSTAPIPTREGLVLAPELLGKEVAVRRDHERGTDTGWETVVSVQDIGSIEVQHITVGDRSFWAGESKGAYILHHNIKMGPGGGDDDIPPWWGWRAGRSTDKQGNPSDLGAAVPNAIAPQAQALIQAMAGFSTPSADLGSGRSPQDRSVTVQLLNPLP